MDLVLVVLLVLAVGGVVALALGRLSGGLVPASDDVAPPLEDGVAAARDLDRARFAVALRGYRMDQVDDVLDQARDLIAARDAEIERLRRRLEPGDGPRPAADGEGTEHPEPGEAPVDPEAAADPGEPAAPVAEPTDRRP